MSKEPNRKPWPKKLLVEGTDDLHVIGNIRKSYQLNDNFEIIDCKGVDKVTDTLLAYIKNRIEVVGVVVDADDKLKSRWESLRNFLIEQGYAVPENPNIEGTIIQSIDRKPRIGIWLMPDNVQQPGMLEHFVAALIPTGDKMKPIAEEVLDRIDALKSAEGERLKCYKPIHRPKALIHTWLAWQEEPGTPMGQAITKKYLEHNSELCQRFTVWLNTLFNS